MVRFRYLSVSMSQLFVLGTAVDMELRVGTVIEHGWRLGDYAKENGNIAICKQK